MQTGPRTYVTVTYELKGPSDIIVSSTDGKSERLRFEDIDEVLSVQLLGKEPRNYWDEPDVLAGPDNLRDLLVQKGTPLEITVERAQLPPGDVQLGQGFVNEDEAGRELPLVVTRIDGTRVTLSKVACLFRYHIHDVTPIGSSFAVTAAGTRPSPPPFRAGDRSPMANETLTQAPIIGSTPASAKPNRLGDTLMGQLGTLLSKALADATSLEVRTFTSDAGAPPLASTGDPLTANTRLRAFTRIAIDGDTQICVPLRASGEPDEALWKLHNDAVVQAREDRSKTIAATISALKELAGR